MQKGFRGQGVQVKGDPVHYFVRSWAFKLLGLEDDSFWGVSENRGP